MTEPVVRVLPADLANQIAAGEVVERPASVVKELVENAIDAGATRVEVSVEAGGVGLVSVVDDGVGMSRGDAELAVQRHATSKIARVEDLHAIGTFGFRGEALPSIASVSRFRLVTKRRDDLEATSITISGGGAADTTIAGAPPGTQVDVRDLFFNVPARRKFLRALPTESAHITEVVEAIALGHPSVTLVLVRDGRLVRSFLRAESRRDRARDVFGEEVLARCVGTRGPLSVEAFLSRPERARSGAGSLAMFVNGRPVKDRGLARSVAHAYGSVLEPGRYPIGVVYLDLPLESVDVNVHPQKSEVRFADGRAIFDATFRVLEAELGRAFNAVLAARRSDRNGPPAGGSGAFAPPSPIAAPPPEAPTANAVWSGSGSIPLDDRTIAPAPYDRAAPDGDGTTAGLRFVAQLRRTYLLCESEDALVILDQHAASERVHFERLRRAIAERGVPRQSLLLPSIVKLEPAHVTALRDGEEVALRMGLDVRPVTADSVAVHAVPAIAARVDPDLLARELGAELARSGGRGFSDAIDKMLATIACHASIRAGDRVSDEDARALLDELASADFGGHCPHGRPIVTRTPFTELERRVGRR